VTRNTLYYGDNLTILREHVADESVDLIYLDPPFNSNATYNVLFRTPAGEESRSQIEAFEDTWHWNDTAERAFDEVMRSGNTDAAEMLRAMRSFLKENDMMAYLAMMAVRLLELHRVLKPTGSLYLHCDPTASHYLKILLDAVFGRDKFVNEITWKRSHAHNDAKQGAKHFGRTSDVLLFYSNSERRTWNVQFTAYDQAYLDRDYRRLDADGRRYRLDNIQGPGGADKGNPYYDVMGVSRYWRYSKLKMQELIDKGLIVQTSPGSVPQIKRYLDEMQGVSVQDIWTDLPVINNRSKEALGYPTQKPLALMERILAASSNEGDVVLDPFCGCGTTIHAAQKMGRRWIGIDVTHLAIGLIRKRLVEAFPRVQYDVVGVPKDAGAARLLAETDKYQFQFWALSMIEAVPYKGGRKGADGGVDGYVYFKPDGRTTEKAVVSVKGGQNVGVGMIRDLIATIERERAKVGILLSLEDATSKMKIEASAAGLYKTEMLGDFPRIQILTVEDLFEGRKPHLPWQDPTVFRKAKREAVAGERKGDQGDLGV
jgi:DNA modification methylase